MSGDSSRPGRISAAEFVCQILLFCAPMHPDVLWETYRDDMTHDTRFRRQADGGSLEDAYNDALLLLERKLNLSNKSLRDFPDIPLAVLPAGTGRANPQLAVERDYDQSALQASLTETCLV
ncbi:hypothetical protein PsorP6_001396 [Peronosclerospora sorghi]|uniref:Uncharacterized protein n=1 Tax=Peronosclerospora sorghi TaxID=230839 RepID=A0ACC0WXL1_9STRA|nr:hypothetical protein PsorP6_001396 [Peronosclerospora sorghi]